MLADPDTAPVVRIVVLTVVAKIRARRGESGVWPALDQALALADETSDLPRRIPVVVAWAEAVSLTGDPDRARALARRDPSLARP